jgi:putative oxidoreductase
MDKFFSLIGRLLLAQIFVVAGASKLGSGYADTQDYMTLAGIPGILLPLVIILEFGGGLALIVGLFTRWVALALAIFSLLAAVFFHTNFADQMQSIMFMKNLAIAGGLLLLVRYGGGELSIDARRAQVKPITAS